MDEYNEEAEFDYEDVIDCVKKYIERPKIKNIFLELDMSKKDIIKFADENLIDAEENEELVDYCKRLINFLAIIQVTKNYVKEIIEKDKKEKIENDEMEESKFLNSFSSAYEDGDVDKIIWLIIKYSKIPVEIEKDASGEIILTPAELTRYQAYIKSYQNDLSIELEIVEKF